MRMPQSALATALRIGHRSCAGGFGSAYQRRFALVRTLASSTTRWRQNRLPAAYWRGGTSRAVIFKAQDLPRQRDQWAAIFRGVIGSPDPYGRQLDGMGGGISSLSKVCVVGPSTVGRAAHVDYTFAAIGVRDDDVDYSSNCGNMSSAVGPFAVDSGLFVPEAGDGECVVLIHNTNTGKIIRSTFSVVGGEAAAGGDFSIDGVAGTAPPVKLEFLSPGGSKTGRLMPTGNVLDRWHELDSSQEGYSVTCVDVGNPCVFVEAEQMMPQIPTALSPTDIEKNGPLMHRLERIRREAGVRMGLADKAEDVPGSVPKIAMVWKPRDLAASNPDLSPESGDICVRALSVGQPHRAVPVTVALALAASAQLPGTVVHKNCLRSEDRRPGMLEISHPTGSLQVDAKFDAEGLLESAALFRTARRLMEGTIFWK